MQNPVTNEIFEPLSDDCAVCRAMAAAQKEGRELSMEELQAAMAQANRGQANKKI